MLVLFLAHHILNRGWYKSLFKGRYTPMRVFQVLVDMLLLAAMAAQMYSGIAMSRHVFTFLPVDGGMALARRLHILGAYWGFILMSVHLGMHWNLFLGMARKRTGKTVPSNLRSSLLFLMGLWTFLAHYLSKGLRKPGGKKKAAKGKQAHEKPWAR